MPGEAPEAIRELGRAALTRAPGRTLYARVDAVEGHDGPRLMELELIEPALYFGTDAGAPALFAAGLEKVRRTRGPGAPLGPRRAAGPVQDYRTRMVRWLGVIRCGGAVTPPGAPPPG